MCTRQPILSFLLSLYREIWQLLQTIVTAMCQSTVVIRIRIGETWVKLYLLLDKLSSVDDMFFGDLYGIKKDPGLVLVLWFLFVCLCLFVLFFVCAVFLFFSIGLVAEYVCTNNSVSPTVCTHKASLYIMPP